MGILSAGVPYGVRLERPRSYLDFKKWKAAAAARWRYRGLTLGARAAGALAVHFKFMKSNKCLTPEVCPFLS